jgi:hypothetical protein
MSHTARDLIELLQLLRFAQDGASTQTQHLLRELARNLIAPGVADVRGGC